MELSKEKHHLHIELTAEQYQKLCQQTKLCGLCKRAYIVRLINGTPIRARPSQEIKNLRGGGAHMQHTYCTPISWDEAQPVDLVFYPGDEHMGIVGSRDECGNLLIIHHAFSQNNVVITGLEGFITISRPIYYTEPSKHSKNYHSATFS